MKSPAEYVRACGLWKDYIVWRKQFKPRPLREKAKERILKGKKDPVQNSVQGRTEKIIAKEAGVDSEIIEGIRSNVGRGWRRIVPHKPPTKSDIPAEKRAGNLYIINEA